MEIAPSELLKERVLHAGWLDAAMPLYVDPSGVSDHDVRQMMRDLAVISAVAPLTFGNLAEGTTVSPAFA